MQRLRSIPGLLGLILFATLHVWSQDSVTGAFQGHVRDTNNNPLSDATIFLKAEFPNSTTTNSQHHGVEQITHADAQGAYAFTAILAGTYSLRAELNGQTSNSVSVTVIGSKTDTSKKTVDLTIAQSPAKSGQATQPSFYDEPQFTVAGVTQSTTSGGHGSDTVLRTTEALAQATASLSNENSPTPTANFAAREKVLREAVTAAPDSFEANRNLADFLVNGGKTTDAVPYLEKAEQLRPQDPAIHRLLGSVEEKQGDPLLAVHEYQRAAELNPNESNLFAWATELLLHNAFEPAKQVFARGTHEFPSSVRMSLGLAVSSYACASYDQAEHVLEVAADLDPNSPTPYLFLGKMAEAGVITSPRALDRLKSFAELQPQNAQANYYYAVAISKQTSTLDQTRRNQAEALLQKAIRLNPQFSVAHLQLGTLYAQQSDYAHAIASYRRAIETATNEDDILVAAHYRLAQAYLRIGDKLRFQQELDMYRELSKKIKGDDDRHRSELVQFVISLKGHLNQESPAPIHP